MKRTARKHPGRKADAVLVSDLHLTETTPVARTDDYIAAQANKLRFLQSLSAANNNCPVLCAGDVFDHWKASPWLCGFALHHIPHPFICIPGQHDLPMHSLEHFDRSALALLDKVYENEEDPSFFVLRDRGFFLPHDQLMFPRGTLPSLFIVGRPFGTLDEFDPKEQTEEFQRADRKILMLHELTWKGKKPSWSPGSLTDLELLDRFGDYFDVIITGDNHGAFVSEKNGTILVNPGSMMRMSADQADYTPHAYLYYADTNEVDKAPFPIEKGVVSRDHIEEKESRDERIAAYIERMSKDWELGLSFRRNLEMFFAENKTTKKVRELIWQHLEAEM